MNKKNLFSIIALLILGHAGFCQERYAPDWTSLKNYRTPEWFRDAKFGIFIHWGPTTVPAFESEWYGYHMHKKNTKDAAGNPTDKPSKAYKYHIENYGPLEKYGYTKFIPQFKAKRFDAEQWIDLFVEAGARYVVPVGEHCDGFAMYRSNITRWNAVNMGPKRDIVGELFAAARNKGLKVGMSSHYAYGWHWWTYEKGYETMDPKLKDFYGAAHDPWSPAAPDFIEHWYVRTMDMMQHYRPDLFWFDLGFSEPEYENHRKKVIANYYNQGIENNQEVVLNYKNIDYKPVPDGAAVLDVESGKLDRIRELPWQTDMSLGGWRWGWTNNYEMRPAEAYIQDLVDIVSKNGCLLLNVAPDKEGRISEGQVSILKQIGTWLRVHGEGIYGTRPFTVFGQGPTNAKLVLHGNTKEQGFTSRDIRYTRKGQQVYAFWLKAEEAQEFLSLSAFGSENHIVQEPVRTISILGKDVTLDWEVQKDRLLIRLPKGNLGKKPIAFRITLEERPPDILKTKSE